MTDTVRVYDFQTEQLTTIPASELAQGMVRARVIGIEGDVWVAASQAIPSEYRHPPFPEDIRDYLRQLQKTFADVYPRTIEQWEDGFRRDTHPDREIALWLYMGDVFEHFTSGQPLDADQKRDIFQVILASVNNGTKHVLATTNPRTLSKKRVREIVDWMAKGRASG
jgi:hypothetical protein